MEAILGEGLRHPNLVGGAACLRTPTVGCSEQSWTPVPLQVKCLTYGIRSTDVAVTTGTFFSGPAIGAGVAQKAEEEVEVRIVMASARAGPPLGRTRETGRVFELAPIPWRLFCPAGVL